MSPLLARLLKGFTIIHSSYNGGKLAKALKSEDPQVRKQAEKTVGVLSIIFLIAVGYLFLTVFWPVVLVWFVIWLFRKIFC